MITTSSARQLVDVDEEPLRRVRQRAASFQRLHLGELVPGADARAAAQGDEAQGRLYVVALDEPRRGRGRWPGPSPVRHVGDVQCSSPGRLVAWHAVQGLVADTCKALNKEASSPAAAQSEPMTVDLCLDLARITRCIYQDGDGITSLFNPI